MPQGERPDLHVPYSVPSFPAFHASDLVRFRLAVNARGWCVGIVWSAQEIPGLPGRAGLTMSAPSDASDALEDYLRDCSERHVDGVVAFDALVADSRGVDFSSPFDGAGADLAAARLWVLAMSEDVAWARGAALPYRTQEWSVPLDASSTLYHLAHDQSGVQLGLVASVPGQILLRADRRWITVPADDLAAQPRLGEWPVRAACVQLYDELGEDLLTTTPWLMDALDARWAGNLWAGVSDPDSAGASMYVYFDDSDEVRGLVLEHAGTTYLRGEGRWFRLPAKQLAFQGTVVEVTEDAISVWDELEAADAQGLMDERLAAALAPAELPWRSERSQIFDFRIPSDIAGRLDPSRPELLAKGPFVVTVGMDVNLLGSDLEWNGDEVQWWDGCNLHHLDHTCATALYEDSGIVLASDSKYHAHYQFRALTLDDAAWALPVGVPTPRDLEEFKAAAAQLLEGTYQLAPHPSAAWEPLPSDGTTLLIDTITGWVFTAEETVIAPLPMGEAYDPFMADKAVNYRIDFGFEYGLNLAKPGSIGIPLDQIDDEDRYYVLIDLRNGNCTEQVAETVLVPTPDDDDEVFDNLVDDCDMARRYAILHGVVPVAPVEIRQLGSGAYELEG